MRVFGDTWEYNKEVLTFFTPIYLNSMKHLAVFPLFVKVLLILAVTSVSCVSNVSLSARLADILEYVETSESISDEEWEYIKEDYYLLVDEFKANISTYTEEEKSQIYEQIGKMSGIIAKREAGQTIGRFNEVLESLPSMLDGFLEGITDGE